MGEGRGKRKEERGGEKRKSWSNGNGRGNMKDAKTNEERGKMHFGEKRGERNRKEEI